MTLLEDSQEGQSKCAHLLYKDSSCVGSDIGNYSVSTYRMSMYASANFSTNWKVTIWKCQWKRHQIAADSTRQCDKLAAKTSEKDATFW